MYFMGNFSFSHINETVKLLNAGKLLTYNYHSTLKYNYLLYEINSYSFVVLYASLQWEIQWLCRCLLCL